MAVGEGGWGWQRLGGSVRVLGRAVRWQGKGRL